MENNFNESMNLGNMASSGYANVNQQPVAPVFQTSTTGNNETITINTPSQPVGQVQQMHSQVVNVVPGTPVDVAAQPVPPTPPTDESANTPNVTEIRDEANVPVAVLKNLVANARKVGNYNTIRTISQVVGIELGDFGIKVKASNGSIDYECIDNCVKYKNYFSACVDIQMLGDLLNNMDFESVTLSITNGILEMVSPTGSVYKLAERIDLSTQQPIELGLTFAINYDDMTPIDFAQLVENINQSKPVRDIPKLDEEFAGVYFSDLVLSSDRLIIYIQDNQPILKTQKFFIGSDLCKIITTMNFNTTKLRIGFTTDTSNSIIAITLSDGRLTICGNVSPTAPINEEVCTKFWNTQFTHNMTIPTSKLTNALKRIALYVQGNQNIKNDYSEFTFSGSSVRIAPESPEIIENLILESNPTNFAGNIRIPNTVFESILTSIKSKTITISVDNEADSFIGIVADNYKWIVALASEDN